MGRCIAGSRKLLPLPADLVGKRTGAHEDALWHEENIFDARQTIGTARSDQVAGMERPQSGQYTTETGLASGVPLITVQASHQQYR